jgi:hypothetical protein
MVQKPEKDKGNETLDFLLEQVKEVLQDKGTKRAERLKAIDLGIKLAVARFRIEGGEGKEGAYFDK